ncbi:hypothetical protein ACJX0J_005420 [Zea mays]
MPMFFFPARSHMHAHIACCHASPHIYMCIIILCFFKKLPVLDACMFVYVHEFLSPLSLFATAFAYTRGIGIIYILRIFFIFFINLQKAYKIWAIIIYYAVPSIYCMPFFIHLNVNGIKLTKVHYFRTDRAGSKGSSWLMMKTTKGGLLKGK